jgi:hypothetical protein
MGSSKEPHLLHHDHGHDATVEAQADGEDPLANTNRPDVLQVDEVEGGDGENDGQGTCEGHRTAISQQVDAGGGQEGESGRGEVSKKVWTYFHLAIMTSPMAPPTGKQATRTDSMAMLMIQGWCSMPPPGMRSEV